MVIFRAPPTAPVDLLYGSSSHRTGLSLQKVSTQPTRPFRVRIVSNLTLSQNYLKIRGCFSSATGVLFLGTAFTDFCQHCHSNQGARVDKLTKFIYSYLRSLIHVLIHLLTRPCARMEHSTYPWFYLSS